MPKHSGRPSKLTKAVKEKFFAAISNGHTYESSCALAGISERAFYQWKAKGTDASEKRNSEYVQFVQELAEKEALAKIKLLSDIQKSDSWQAKAWILERRWPEEWGRKDKVSIEKEIEQVIVYLPDNGRTQIEGKTNKDTSSD
ncbi:hypothetical protein CH379_018015 [Leptospira ellisii]|uniref:Terminase n=1 Tax=Leptospira ellisii TaxID=2023197 RepID=A0AAE4U251_9LEPT|nr:hypothetical protein [Leptospira ellisii]MDV6237532.1 hypothetical protein [Leptospira ellisii]